MREASSDEAQIRNALAIKLPMVFLLIYRRIDPKLRFVKAQNFKNQGLDGLGPLGLDEKAKSVYPFFMSQKNWRVFALDICVLFGALPFLLAAAASTAPSVKPVSVGKTDDARDQEFVEIQKEANNCQNALKTDRRAGFRVCGQEKAARTISQFICQNSFFPCGKDHGAARLQAGVGAVIFRPKSPFLQIQKGRGNLAELLVVLKNQDTAAKLAQACSGKTQIQGFKSKPCKKWDGRDTPDRWIPGFIAAAMDNAHYFYRVKVGKASASKTLKSIQKNSGPSSAFGTGAGKTPAGGVSRSFGVEQLYQDGAVTSWVVTNPKTGAGRWISVKYFTQREPGTDKLIQQVGVFDYTENPSQIYGRRYAVGQDMDADNLDLVPNRAKFHVTIKNGEVTVSAAGSSQPAIRTTLSNLKQRRLAQVNKEGYEQTIGNQTFKVIGQGGAEGALLFFKEDAQGRVSEIDPVAIANVNEMTDTGVKDLSSTPYHTGLGFFTGKDGTTNFYYMKRMGSGDMSYFEPVVCQESEAEKVGEKCNWKPAQQPAAKDKGGKTGGGQSAGGTDNSGDVSKAGDCSGDSNFKNPINQDGVLFVPEENASLRLCVDGNEMVVNNGLLMAVKKNKDGGVVLQVATTDIPKDFKGPKPDYQTIYSQSLQSTPVVKHEDRGANLTSSFPTVYDIPIKQVKTYSLSSSTLKNMSASKYVQNVKNLADSSVIEDVAADNGGKFHASLVQISASNSASAQSTWSSYRAKYPYYGKINDFLKSSQCSQGFTGGERIKIRPLLGNEIKSAQPDQAVVTCGKNKLTVQSLLN